MLRRLNTFFCAAFLVCALPAFANPMPAVTAGKLERIENFPSRHVDPRNVDVWLPPGYDAKSKYPVLYMHDGQMLFDPATTWNKQAWQVDKVAARLIAEKKIRPFILVGVWNNGKKRHAEFFPQKYLPHLPDAMRSAFVEKALLGQPLADAYLKFLVSELKPAIDQRYATLTGPGDTFLMGSSMGGMISVYGLCEYSQVFGGAAALSTHWIAVFESNTDFPQAATRYLKDHLPKPGARKLYMDRGDQELDAKYGEAQAMIDTFMKAAGYREPFFVTRLFAGTGHNERAWNARLDVPLVFLLGVK
jgi:enterochelin esterase-like enzyme